MQRVYTVDNPPGRFRVLLNGEEVRYVAACRAGSNGWVDAHGDKPRVNRTRDAVKRLPRQRGHVEVVPCNK